MFCYRSPYSLVVRHALKPPKLIVTDRNLISGFGITCVSAAKGTVGTRFPATVDDESFKFRALSAGAVMAFDGQTELSLLPSKYPKRLSPFVSKLSSYCQSLNSVFERIEGETEWAHREHRTSWLRQD
jgi:hypothetical protein